MALAIECGWLIREGVIKNQSELAHYSQVTTARMTHIMWLTNLAPEIQEAILYLPRVESGPDTVKEIDVRRIARLMNWGVQRGMWREYLSAGALDVSMPDGDLPHADFVTIPELVRSTEQSFF